MSKKNIRFVSKLITPKIRKRDGELLTHFLHIALTTPEAIAVQELFDSRKDNSPSISLIRAFLISHALEEITEETLINAMATLKAKEMLADALAKTAFDKAINFVKNPPETPPKQIISAQKERRVFIPEPRRR